MKLIYSLYKEYKILIRDRAGLAITFIMPTALILIMTLIQDSTFKSVNESSVPLLFVDRDHDSLSQTLEKYIHHSGFFKITKKQLSNEEVKKEVAQGHFLIGIVIPENTSKNLREQSDARITGLLNSFSGDSAETVTPGTSDIQLNLFFDPVTKQSFKTTISSAIDRIISQIEMQGMISALYSKMKETFPDAKSPSIENAPLVNVREEYASYNDSTIIPNAVQHNVPAWTLFAMFFICIPLAGNIIRERQEGSAFRLLTMPGSYIIVMLGKLVTYTMVSLLQFILMLCVGVFILPMLGITALNIGNNLPMLFIIALSAGLAATGFGLLVGTIATSHDQASLFGSVFIIILAAIGGVWVPVFVMPEFMKTISVISPLNWGLESFYAVFIRNSALKEIWPEILKLLSFFAVTLTSAYLFQKYRRLN